MRDVLIKIDDHAPARRLLYVGIDPLEGRVHACVAVCEVMIQTCQKADGRRREIHSKTQANFLFGAFGYTACLLRLSIIPAFLLTLLF